MASVIKSLLLKYIEMGISREFFLPAIGLAAILWGPELGLPAQDAAGKIAIALIVGIAVFGIFAKKYIDAIKAPTPSVTITAGNADLMEVRNGTER